MKNFERNQSVELCKQSLDLNNCGDISRVTTIRRYYQIFLDYVYSYALQKNQELYYKDDELEIDDFILQKKQGKARNMPIYLDKQFNQIFL
ncbi:hypothetical protein TTHERM_01498880 (macronuclear) [Tetrahymena thermophila SB210]|uniref:Uncharacterized protein n=1 Tax=Tetrahymena thermophila (strain SB210) TaxID=312017 RepID=Q228U0_TETTS|nr:hypothetical protein TTHERM_01498880 [Tetrahymena thermophila SB210]EAR81809.1 hypothetical protein TTHERM_01498880 [Tetrahymena thermophila SB210]|eukprot:XP_001029472.1 hypothetical protein TTHERM_01498880 [Tetrahymena thermophila SB210]